MTCFRRMMVTLYGYKFGYSIEIFSQCSSLFLCSSGGDLKQASEVL